MAWVMQPLDGTHGRGAFQCREPALVTFLQTQAKVQQKQGTSRTFVLVDDQDEDKLIRGYYTLLWPASRQKDVPLPDGRTGKAVLLARMARDDNTERGVGLRLFAHACVCARHHLDEIGGDGMVIDAKNSRVADWYVALGAQRISDLYLFIPRVKLADVAESIYGIRGTLDQSGL